MVKRRDEYDIIYDYDDYDEEDSRNYEELSETNEDEKIEKLRGKIGRGYCLYCGAENGMIYEGDICFICTECGKSVHEDLYYRWAAGYDVYLDE